MVTILKSLVAKVKCFLSTKTVSYYFFLLLLKYKKKNAIKPKILKKIILNAARILFVLLIKFSSYIRVSLAYQIKIKKKSRNWKKQI